MPDITEGISDDETPFISVTRRRGRPKGSRGRRAADAKAIIEKIGVDPLELLMRFATDHKVCVSDRIKASAAACSYVHPRLSTSRVENRTSITVEQTTVLALMADPAAAKLAETLALKLVTLRNAERPVINPDSYEPKILPYLDSADDQESNSLLPPAEGEKPYEPGEDDDNII